MPRVRTEDYEPTIREEIEAELLNGIQPYHLCTKYPTKSVYRIYNELVSIGRLTKGGGVSMATSDSDNVQPRGKGRPPTVSTITSRGVEVVEAPDPNGELGDDIGQGKMSDRSLDTVRGSLGIVARPKVLTIPMPELLYPAMVISIEEWKWSPMRPDDFIDTVLDKFIRATGYEVPGYIKTVELQDVIKFAKLHGYKFKNNGNHNGDHDGNGHKPDVKESIESLKPPPVTVKTEQEMSEQLDVAEEELGGVVPEQVSNVTVASKPDTLPVSASETKMDTEPTETEIPKQSPAAESVADILAQLNVPRNIIQ